MATSTLLFATGQGSDNVPYLFAVDKRTGARLGKVRIPANSQYGMMTYVHEGKQYIVVQMTGRLLHAQTPMRRRPEIYEPQMFWLCAAVAISVFIAAWSVNEGTMLSQATTPLRARYRGTAAALRQPRRVEPLHLRPVVQRQPAHWRRGLRSIRYGRSRFPWRSTGLSVRSPASSWTLGITSGSPTAVSIRSRLTKKGLR